MTASTITIVTKNTPQSYTGGTTAAAKGTVLSVVEVDSNFINLKEGIIVLEAELASTDASIRSYVNTNFIQSFSPVFYGVPTSPDPGATGTSSQVQTVGGVNLLVSPLSSIVNSPTTGNIALSSQLSAKANINSPQFTGVPQLTGSLYNFSNYDANNNYIPKVEYVKDKLENLSGDVKPVTAGGANLGTSTEYFDELHVNAILPGGSNASIGTPTNRFPFGYFDTGDFGPNTILVGSAEISASGDILVVPASTAIGQQENVLPLNIASTSVDTRFGSLSLIQPLDQEFTASGAISTRDPVAINSDGTVSSISSSVSNLNYIGFALSSVSDGASINIRVHGELTGFTGLTSGDSIFVRTDGSLSQSFTGTSLKVGTALSTTEVLLFTTSNLDTYLLNIKKTELSDFSATTAGSPSGSGGLSYNSTTGAFTFTPADTSSFASISYVDTEIANLVNSAPAALDTLDELAAALNDDANFATTVTNSLALKAPLADPALTGAPTAPTASSGTNTTQIATTAFVQTEISGLGNASLNSFSVTSNSASGGGALAYNNTSGVFTYTPPDLSTFLTSYTETDPVVGAINGIVKADGSGNISAAIAGTDYSTFDGAFSSLTGTPTTISGYGITDAAPLASPALTGTPTAPTATAGTNTTQIATTAFVQTATSGSIQLTDLSISTASASSGGALSYNSSSGVFTFTPADTSSFGNASLNSFSVSTTSASGGGALTYNNANGVFSFTPPDLSSYLTSYTETDPIVGAITGIVKADGAGNISAAVAGTDYSTFDGAFSSLTGTPTTISGYGITDAFDGAFSSLTGTPTTISGYGITDAFDGAFSSLTGTPTTISGYGITDPIAYTNADIDIGSNDFITTGQIYYANMFAQTSNLPSATTYHGMFAHVHATGKGYFAHAGNWVELANASTTLAGYGITDGATISYVDTEIANLIDSAPGALDTLNELAAALGDDPNFATTVTNSLASKAPLADPALTGTPTAPTAAASTNTTQIATTAFVQQEIGGLTSYSDSDVNTHLNTSTASSGEVLSWNGTDYDWVAQSGGGGGGGASVTVSGTAPSSPSAGDLWFDDVDLVLYVYYNDGTSNQWVQTNPSGAGGSSSGGASVTVGNTAPTSPTAGDLWFDDDDLFLYVYIDDGSSTQWVKTNPSGGGSSNSWAEKTAAYTAEAGDRLIVDTSTAVTVTLPVAAVLGDEIRIIDGTGNAATNNITVARNGHNIEGSATDLTIDVDRAAFGLVYYNATQGWVMMER